MKNNFLSGVIFMFIVICTFAFFYEDDRIRKTDLAEHDIALQQSITSEVTEALIGRTLLGYEVVSFRECKTTNEDMTTEGAPSFYVGKAVCSDGIGNCDTIKFISMSQPKLGKARFRPDYGSTDWKNNWRLTEQ
jgi:hypothetical protein